MLKKLFKIGPKKEDTIQVWSTERGLSGVIPVQESFNFMPDWFVKAPKWKNEKIDGEKNKKDNVNNKGTIKRCPAVPEFMGMGITIPLWWDLRLQIFDDGSHQWNTPAKQFGFTLHDSSQLNDWLPSYAKPTLVLKADCPWRIKTPPGVSLLQLPMLWHFNPNFTVCSGVIWTDIHYEINQQMMFHKRGEIMIQRGTPLAQYIPIRRETFKYDIGDQTPEQYTFAQESWLHIRTKFQSGYPQHRKNTVKKELEKCPHHKK